MKIGAPRKESRRRKRGVHGRGRLKLNVPEIPGYYCRWANDMDNRLYELTVNDDYTHVDKSEIDNNVGESGDGNTDIGSKVRVLVGKDENGPIFAYLLKKKLEFHEEDKAENETFRREKENSLRRGTDDTGSEINEQYGSIT